MTVFGKPIVLPKIETPSSEDIDKWHAAYVEVSTLGIFAICTFLQAEAQTRSFVLLPFDLW